MLNDTIHLAIYFYWLVFDGEHSKPHAVLSLFHIALFNSSIGSSWKWMNPLTTMNPSNKTKLRVVNRWCTHHQIFVPSRRVSYILTYVRVVLATLDVQSILEILATDEIHMEDRNHGLA